MQWLATTVGVLALLAGFGVNLESQPAQEVTVSLAGGDPGSGAIPITVDGDTAATVTPGASGDVLALLNLANLAQKQITVAVETCTDGTTTIRLVSQPPPPGTEDVDDGCDRRLVGAFWAHRTRLVQIDLGAGTMKVDGTGMSTTTKAAIIGGAAAAGVAVAVAGGSSSSPGQPPAGSGSGSGTAPPPPASSISGTYSFSGSLQTGQNCRVAGVVPVFQPSINGSMTLEIGSDGTGTATTTYPNGWKFIHRVLVELFFGTPFRVRSQTPFVNSEPFGGSWQASIDFEVSDQFALNGTETHMRTDGGPTCTDTYNVQGTRQGF